MTAYLVIFGMILSIAIISAVVNAIANKKNPNSVTADISHLFANGFGIISFFMFWFGLLCTC